MSSSSRTGTPGDILPTALALLDQLGPAMARADRAQQVDIIQKLIALRAPMGSQWQQLTYLAERNGEFALAREALELFVEASGGGPVGQYWKVALLFDLGFWREAGALLQTLPHDVPDPASNAYSRGITALSLGQSDKARQRFEEVTLLRPGMGSAWLALAQSVDLARATDVAERVIAAEQGMAQAIPAERAQYYYALGKLYADRGEYAPAFAAFARGAELMKSVVSYNRQDDRAAAANAISGYSAEGIAALGGKRHKRTDRTIFVMGLPRSGTTLVEQILTSHTAVSQGAELSLLSLLAAEVGGSSFSALASYVEAHGTAAPADLWHHWLDGRFPGPGRIVNKAVTTSRFLGVAAALLPDAPLIWMTRDPLDRAWSCLRTAFLGGSVPWSYDLRDIAFHFRLEDQLLAEWQRILGERLLVVPYEALVDDPPLWTRRILSHCGLSEEPQVFAPHENARTVATASLMQVRRPINRDGIGAAEPYRTFLQPFIEDYYR